MFLAALAFLLLSLLSLWVRKNFWIWGSLLIISLVLAQLSKQLTSYGLIPIFLSIFLFWTLSKKMPQLLRFACVILALFFTGTLFSCLAPGVPACFSFFKTNINYGKAIITLPLLGFIVPILSYKNIASFFLTRHFALSICSALILSVIAHFWFTNSDALRFPSSFLLTLISYLFFSILPEEALLRGFLQKEILPWVGKGWAAHITTCAITAALFTLFHLSWIANLPLIGLIFIAGLLYGILYEVTKIIEVPIFCRLLTNILCFFFLPWQGVL